MSVIAKIQRRNKYPVELEVGTVHVRPLGYWERQASESLNEGRIPYYLGCALVEEDGSRTFEIGTDETPTQFADRVRNETRDLSAEDISALMQAITKVTRVPPADTVVKNSEATDTPAS